MHSPMYNSQYVDDEQGFHMGSINQSRKGNRESNYQLPVHNLYLPPGCITDPPQDYLKADPKKHRKTYKKQATMPIQRENGTPMVEHENQDSSIAISEDEFSEAEKMLV